MRSRAARLLLVLLAAALAAPAAAEVYTVRLTNGTIFESRYPPRVADWDRSQLTFLDEAGLLVALPRALVASVGTLAETRGYGKVIDTTTVDLGYMPNDLPEQQRQAAAAAAALAASGAGGLYTTPQFVEPGQGGGGIPVWAAGGGAIPGSAINPGAAAAASNPVGTPPPFSSGQPTGGTPPPFSTVPTVATPFSGGQPTGGTPAPFTTTPTAPATATAPATPTGGTAPQ